MRELAAGGAKVVIADFNLDAAEKLAKEVGSASAFKVDVADPVTHAARHERVTRSSLAQLVRFYAYSPVTSAVLPLTLDGERLRPRAGPPALGEQTRAVLERRLVGYGNVGRNTFDGPGLFNIDFSMFRKFPIMERVKGEFKLNEPESVEQQKARLAQEAAQAEATIEEGVGMLLPSDVELFSGEAEATHRRLAFENNVDGTAAGDYLRAFGVGVDGADDGHGTWSGTATGTPVMRSVSTTSSSSASSSARL